MYITTESPAPPGGFPALGRGSGGGGWQRGKYLVVEANLTVQTRLHQRSKSRRLNSNGPPAEANARATFAPWCMRVMNWTIWSSNAEGNSRCRDPAARESSQLLAAPGSAGAGCAGIVLLFALLEHGHYRSNAAVYAERNDKHKGTLSARLPA